MQKTISIYCLNDGVSHEVVAGSTLLEALAECWPQGLGKALVARVNNVTRPLDFPLYKDCHVEYLDLTASAAQRAYVRSLLCALGWALKRVIGQEADFCVEAPVSNGYFCRLRLGRPVTDADVATILAEIDKIKAEDVPYRNVTRTTDEVIALMESLGRHDTAQLLRTKGTIYSTYVALGDYVDFYDNALIPSTGRLTTYGLMRYADGVLLRVPDANAPTTLRPLVKQEKMLGVFRALQDWQDIVGLRTMGDLNAIAQQRYMKDVILIAEALQEKRICKIAEAIEQRPEVRMVLISGPSSSGKTTFSLRLSVQLAACGLKPYPIAMDDYFVDRAKTPRDENGDYDFESIDALNIPLLQEHLQALLDGKEVELPRFDFHTGQSVPSGRKLKLGPRDMIVMEGIHALNPKLTTLISDLQKFKVYVSALTTLSLDDHNYIPTTDNRLLRRIVRDYKYRGYSAADTISRWPSVRKGEDKWIFPFQENADCMFNSALLYELAGLKVQAEPVLEQVSESAPEYTEAHRLLKFLSCVRSISLDQLPPTSLLREFLGGSSFDY